jgi:hypothetical protein
VRAVSYSRHIAFACIFRPKELCQTWLKRLQVPNRIAARRCWPTWRCQVGAADEGKIGQGQHHRLTTMLSDLHRRVGIGAREMIRGYDLLMRGTFEVIGHLCSSQALYVVPAATILEMHPIHAAVTQEQLSAENHQGLHKQGHVQ